MFQAENAFFHVPAGQFENHAVSVLLRFVHDGFGKRGEITVCDAADEEPDGSGSAFPQGFCDLRGLITELRRGFHDPFQTLPCIAPFSHCHAGKRPHCRLFRNSGTCRNIFDRYHVFISAVVFS